MKLLILTQKVDADNPELGFFHAWLKEFSEYCEKITVVCLGKGRYDLSSNTEVLSLGKERGVSRFSYVILFYKHILSRIGEYDSVFVHMNQEYVLLGGLIWKIFGKKVLLWRNHAKGSFLTDVAVFMSDKVFYTSPHSYTTRFKKARIMPVGIDIDFFRRRLGIDKVSRSILLLGRISPVKNPILFLEALDILNKSGVQFNVTIVGSPTDKDTEYYREFLGKIKKYSLGNKTSLFKSVRNEETINFYNRCEMYVNLTPSGSMDKTIFEAMASGALTIVGNTYFRGVLPEELIFKEGDAEDLARKIKGALAMPQGEKDKIIASMRKYVEDNHSLGATISGILKAASADGNSY